LERFDLTAGRCDSIGVRFEVHYRLPVDDQRFKKFVQVHLGVRLLLRMCKPRSRFDLNARESVTILTRKEAVDKNINDMHLKLSDVMDCRNGGKNLKISKSPNFWFFSFFKQNPKPQVKSPNFSLFL